MAEFSYEDYFAQRASEAMAPPATDKYADVEKASNEKSVALEKLANIREQNKKSILGSLGLDVDSYAGAAVNTVASSVAGVTDALGGDLDAYVATKEDTGQKHSSIQRRAGDVGISALKGAIAVPEMAVGLASMVSGGHAGKLLNEAGFRPEESKAFLDTLYSHEQKAANEQVHGAEGFWTTMAEIVDNPSTVPHALVESLFPMLAGGVAARGLQALGMGVKGATALGEGTVMAGSAAESIRNQTEDKLLTPKQAFIAALNAPMGAAVARVGMKGGEKLGLGDIDEAVVRGTFGTSKHGALVNAAGSGALEAAEEGLQSTGETMLSNLALDKELTDGVGNAAALGMVTGAAMGAPMGLAANAEKPANLSQRIATDRATFDAAVSSNDPSIFLDQAAPTYDPSKAVAVLMQNNKSAAATPETKAANLERATAIVSDLDSDLQNAKDILAEAEELTPALITQYQAVVAEQEAKLAAMDPADTAGIEAYKQGVAEVTELLRLTDPEARKLRQLEIARMDRDNVEARKVYEVMSGGKDVAAKMDAEVVVANATVDVADAAAVKASQTAADMVINLSMKSPTALSAEQATEMAENTGNALTPEQRTYLRTFAEARVAENTLKTLGVVAQQVYFGSVPGSKGQNYVGIKQYQDTISDAIRLNSVKKATTALSGITAFAKDHESKAATVLAAAKQFKQSNTDVQVVSDGNGAWSIHTGTPLSNAELRKNGGLTINARSSKLVADIPVEAEAITKAAAALKLAVERKFNSKSVASATPAVQAPAAPTPAASVASAAPVVKETPKADTEQAVVATAKTAEAVEEENPPNKLTAAEEMEIALLKNNPESLKEYLEDADSTIGGMAQKALDAKEALDYHKGDPYGRGYVEKVLIERLTEDFENKVEFLVQAVHAAEKRKAPKAETKRVDSAPPKEVTSPAPLIDRTDENSGSTLRPTETVGDTTQEDLNSDTKAQDGAPVASPDGTLKVFAKRLVRKAGETINQLYEMEGFNQVAQFLKQDKTNEQDASTRPLVAVEDFIKNWAAGNVQAEDYLDLGKDVSKRELTEEEQYALKNLREFITEWMPKLQANFILDTETQAAFRTDRMQDFYSVNEQGEVDVDENVKAAIAYAMYSYILDKANAPALKTKEQVVDMHRSILDAHGIRDENPTIDIDGLKQLQEMDVFEETLVDDLGQRVIQALGLKALGKDTPTDLMPKLAVAFGTHAMIGLAQGKKAQNGNARIPGFIEVVEIPRNTLYGYLDIPAEENNKVTLKYIKFNYATETREDKSINQYALTDKVRAIRDAVSGSHGVVDKLFSVEHTPREALDTPTKMTQKYAKGTKQEVSKLQAKAIDATQQTPHTVIQGMKAVLDKFGEMTILKAAGWKEVNLEDPNYHVMNQPGIEAQNRNLEDQLDQMTAMWDKKDGLEKAYYVLQSVWRNFRAGFSNGSLNQQSSKIHRFMFSRPEWQVTIELDNQELVNEFLISAAMAMGEKTDAQRNVVSLEKYFDDLDGIPTFKNEKVMQAIRAIQNSIYNDTTPTEQEIALVQDVASGSEGMMSLQAMQVYADFLQAKETNQTSFDVSMLVGADGKTNGPMLTLFALGATDYETLNRGGFYSTEADQFEHYSAYAESPGARDLYQDVGSEVASNMRAKAVSTAAELPAALAAHYKAVKEKKASRLDVPFSLEQAGHLIHLTGALYDRKKDTVEKALRNLVKTPLTAFFFGSSLKNSARSMENAFIDSWYDTIQDIKQGKQKKGMTLASFIKATNGMIQTGDQAAPLLDVNMDIDAAMQYMLHKNKKQELALRKGFQILMGNSVQSAFKPYFETFIERRNKITQSVHAAHSLYTLAYEDAKQKMLAELKDKGEIRYRVISQGKREGEIEYLQDLTVGQEAELQRRIKALWPVAHNAMSKSEDNLNAGSFMGKEVKDTSKADLYKAVVMTRKGKRTNSGMVRKMVNNGVGSLSALIHSLDSANMHMALNKVPGSMNVHDEIGNGVDKVAAAAAAINQTTSENLLNFSPAREAYNLLQRSLLAFAEMAQQEDFDPALVKHVAASWMTPAMEKADLPLADVFAVMMTEAFDAANAADQDRLTLLTKLASTDQYTWEGGQYKIDDAFRAKAQELLAALPDNMPAEVQIAIKELSKLALNAGTTTEKPAAADSFDLEDTSKPVDSLGRLGQSRVKSDPKLVALFNKNKSIPVKDLLDHLVREFNSKAKNAPGNEQYRYFKHLAMQLYQNSKSGAFSTLTVNLVTPDMTTEDVINTPAPGSMGWYASNTKGEQAIYVLSDAFQDSGLTPELMLHELLHGALARSLKAQGTSNPLVAEITELYGNAVAHAKELGLEVQYAEALSNIDEFISWGMTNKAFQDNVLHTMQFKSQTKSNTFVSGMKAFITFISKALFPGKTAKDIREIETGMTALISNVSGLLAQNVPAEAADISQSQVNTAAQAYTTESLFEALPSGNISSEFKGHLQGLLSSMVEKLYGPFGVFAEPFMKTAAGNPLDIFAKAKTTGIAPFASKVQASGLNISEQELFVIEQMEATMRTALADGRAPARAAYRELSKLYEDVRNKLMAKPAKDTATQALLDFLFTMEANGDRTDHLSRFAALGLGNETVNKLLNIPTSHKVLVPFANQTFRQWLHGIFDVMLEWLNARLSHTYGGQLADSKLSALVGQLVDIEARRREGVAESTLKKNYPAVLDEKLSDGVAVVVDKLEQFGRSQFFSNSKHGVVKAAGRLGSMVLGDRQQYFLAALTDLRDKHSTGRPDLLAGLINELRDPNRLFHKLLRASKDRDKHMVHVNTQTAHFVLEGFVNLGKDLKKQDKDSLSFVALRTGMHSLLGKFDMLAIQNLLEDPKALEDAIDTQVESLKKTAPKSLGYYVTQAKDLALSMVTGQDGTMTVKNVGNIARFYGLQNKPAYTEAQAKDAEAILEVLVTLYALSYSYQKDTSAVLEILKKENARTDKGNGLESLLSLHKELEQQARERVFEGSEVLMSKGYIPEIVNQQTDVVVADELTGKDLIDQGYTQLGAVTMDRTDPDRNTTKHLYAMRDAGNEPLMTTIMAYQGLHAKGTSAVGASNNSVAVQRMTAAKQTELQVMFNYDPSYDPRKKPNSNNAAPVFNSKGEIVNWNYRMHRNTKDSVLQRDNRFEVLMGQLAGSIYDKATVTENNTALINALYEMHEADFAAQPNSFIQVGPNSVDPEMREIYRLLPDATKRVVEQVWGKDGMMVRRDMLDISFGYHKLSVANMFEKSELERTAVENAIVVVVELMFEQVAHLLNQSRKHKGLPLHDPVKYARRAAHVVRRSERMWQAIVKEIKDIIIIKSGVVLLANITSNFMQLKMNGVPWADMVKDSLIAARGARDYQRDNAKLFQLETQLENGIGVVDAKEIEREITRLKDALSRNPVKGMIDMGMMPTIVDDVVLADDIYSYKSELVRKTEKITEKLNPKVLEFAKAVYMAKDTKMYQALSQITQLSDFVARYAMYQHLTQRDINKLPSEIAVQQASDAFINYDLPLHRQLQYSDDMGFTMFSKYFIRIQRVLLKLLQEHPGNVMTVMALDQLLSIPNAMESSMLVRIGNNPFSTGAAQIVTMGDDLLTVKATLGLMQ